MLALRLRGGFEERKLPWKKVFVMPFLQSSNTHKKTALPPPSQAAISFRVSNWGTLVALGDWFIRGNLGPISETASEVASTLYRLTLML